MNDWYYDSDWAKEDTIEDKRKRCWHEWKAILLLHSTVYDCVKCGIKKENYEKQIYSDDEKKSVF
jgi:hypothetical protein